MQHEGDAASMAARIKRVAAAMLGVAVLLLVLCAWLTKRDGAVVPVPAGVPYMSLPVSWLAAIGAICVFGTFAATLKLPSFVQAEVDPLVQQGYVGMSAGVVSLCVALFTDFEFTWWGVAGAALWSVANAFAIAAIQNVGYAVGMAVWAGGTIVVAFIWGALYFNQVVNSALGSVAAITVLLLGIGTAAAAQSTLPQRLAARCCPGSATLPSERSELLTDKRLENTAVATSPPAGAPAGPNRPVLGLCCAVTVAFFNGAMEVPFSIYQNDQASASAIGYIVSFGVGLLLVTPVMCGGYVGVRALGGKRPALQPRVAAVPGATVSAFYPIPAPAGPTTPHTMSRTPQTGAMFAIGNVLATWSTQYMGETIGFPLTQLAMMVTAFWGVVLYKEITGTPAVVTLLVGCATIIGGAVLLALYG